jgi:hypothetical protein
MKKKIKVSGYNFFHKKYGQRDTPYVYFYLTPLLGYSKTKSQSYCLHLGWLYFTILIEVNK